MENCCSNKNNTSVPQKLKFHIIDYLKIFYSWLRAFKSTFIIEPGLYFIGNSYDKNSPLLVTCNYHMTVFLLWKKLKNHNLRVLIIDTKGINVWCSSGKGQFSAEEIIRQLNRYSEEFLNSKNGLEVILPKLSLSGVKLSTLRKRSIKPIIGPIYIKDIPVFLDDIPHKNRYADKYKFNLSDRIFTLLPSLVQTLFYSLFVFLGLFLIHLILKTGIWWQIILLMYATTFLYILLFPILPSKKFALKGIFLTILQLIFLIVIFSNMLDLFNILIYSFFIFGFNIFFGLYYTGNSGVSNYSLVKKEIIFFLPVSAILLFTSLVTLILKGVLK